MALALTTFACIRRPRERSSPTRSGAQAASRNQTPQTELPPANLPQLKSPGSDRETPQRININHASARELEKLAGIGPALAQRIVEHREKYGPFRRSEHLIMVRGFSDRRVRTLRDMITVE
jgi:competence protein ComEA